MTNEEAIHVLVKVYNIDTLSEELHEALECAIAALDTAGAITIDITEHHTFAKPDDVSDLDFPGVSSEDK